MIRFILAVALLAITPLRAQIVNDGATNTLSNSTNSFTGDVIVGTNGSFTLLVLSDNSLLTNSTDGTIGLNITARSNEVRLASPSARWQVGGTFLNVGSNGAFNRLVVSNGGMVRSGHGYVGVNPRASNNLALVTGAGSVWTNALDLEVGSSEGNNQMIVSSGATVFAASNGLIGSFTNANGNSVTVTDPGTGWLIGNNLYVGSNGANASLVVSNGALVGNNIGTVGTRIEGSNNAVLVTGGGSLWTNRNTLNIAGFGRGNPVIGSNGGWVGGDR